VAAPSVGHQLGIRLQPDRIERAVHLDARMLGKLARQDLQRCRQPQVRQRRGPQVLDDAPLQCGHAVEHLDQVAEPLQGLGRGARQPRLDARRIEPGRGQQGTEFVVQLACQVVALVFACVQQVLRQLGQLRRALSHLELQPVVRGLHQAMHLALLHLQRQGLAQEQHQRQQAAPRTEHDQADRQQIGSHAHLPATLTGRRQRGGAR
jgi:hypothetical protein